jgi:hypothetical protein
MENRKALFEDTHPIQEAGGTVSLWQIQSQKAGGTVSLRQMGDPKQAFGKSDVTARSSNGRWLGF